jgi:hypothetical protein
MLRFYQTFLKKNLDKSVTQTYLVIITAKQYEKHPPHYLLLRSHRHS